jgi:hypothetical protein
MFEEGDGFNVVIENQSSGRQKYVRSKHARLVLSPLDRLYQKTESDVDCPIVTLAKIAYPTDKMKWEYYEVDLPVEIDKRDIDDNCINPRMITRRYQYAKTQCGNTGMMFTYWDSMGCFISNAGISTTKVSLMCKQMGIYDSAKNNILVPDTNVDMFVPHQSELFAKMSEWGIDYGRLIDDGLAVSANDIDWDAMNAAKSEEVIWLKK